MSARDDLSCSARLNLRVPRPLFLQLEDLAAELDMGVSALTRRLLLLALETAASDPSAVLRARPMRPESYRGAA